MLDFVLRIIYALLFMATPLLMSSSTSELFEFNKIIFIYLSALSVAFVWTVKMIFAHKIILKRTLLDIPLLFFLSVLFLSTLFSIDFNTSLFGYYGRFNGGLISIIAYTVLYFGFVSNISKQFVKKLLFLSLIISAVVVLWGLPGKIGFDLSCLVFAGQFNNSCWTDQFRPAERMFSTLGQPNWLGAYLAIHFFIALFLFFDKKDEKHTLNKINLLFYGYIFLNWTGILFTRSRSAILSVVTALGAFFFTYFLVTSHKKKQIHIDPRLLVIFFLVFIPIILFKTGIGSVDSVLLGKFFNKDLSQPQVKNQAPTPEPKIETNLVTESGVTESFDIRKIVWEGAIELGKKYPLLGTGPETFAYAYYFVRPQAHNLTSEWDFLYNKAHNEYLNYLATTGFLGLISYLAIIICSIFIFIQIVYQKKVMWPIFFLLSYGTILLTNFFGFSTTTIQIFFYLLPGIALILARSDNEDTEANTPKLNNWKQWISILGALILFSAACVYIFRYYTADILYTKADSAYKMQEYQAAANGFNKALTYHYDHVYQDKLSYTLANIAYVASYQKEEDLVKQLVPLSIHYNTESIKASPKNILYWKTKAKNEYLFYQITLDNQFLKQGIETLKVAEKLGPTDPKLNYSLALMYSLYAEEMKDADMKKELEDLSIAEVDKSIALKNNYKDSYVLRGQLLKKYGRNKEAKDTLQFLLDHFDPNDPGVIKEIEGL